MYCNKCGSNNDADAIFCSSCGNTLNSGQQVPPVNMQQQNFASQGGGFQNNSGQGKLAALPPQLYGWNWGAFFLSWIWGIGNNTMIAFLTWIPFVNFVMIFILGAKGNEWAWQNKHWQSIEHFKKVQKLWAIWGFILFVIGMLFSLLVLVAAMDSY